MEEETVFDNRQHCSDELGRARVKQQFPTQTNETEVILGADQRDVGLSLTGRV